MLSSMANWHSGFIGHQAIPWIASTGQLAVFGVVGEGQQVPTEGTCASQGLPYVVQSRNLALVGYHPDSTVKSIVLAEGGNVDVLFYWPFASFSETVQSGNWTVSREGTSFVAMRPVYLPPDKTVIVGSDYMWSDADPSVWAVMVGNANVHGSFAQFITLLESSEVSTTADEQFITSEMNVDGSNLVLELPL